MPEFIDQVFAKTSPKRSFSVIQNERFELVFAKTGSINSGTDGCTPCCWNLAAELLAYVLLAAVLLAAGLIAARLLAAALQTILELCIPEKELAKTKLVPKFNLYISKVIHDILSGTTRSQKEL